MFVIVKKWNSATLLKRILRGSEGPAFFEIQEIAKSFCDFTHILQFFEHLVKVSQSWGFVIIIQMREILQTRLLALTLRDIDRAGNCHRTSFLFPFLPIFFPSFLFFTVNFPKGWHLITYFLSSCLIRL